MGLNLRDADIAALEARTEGWIAGLQMAALSMQGRPTPLVSSRPSPAATVSCSTIWLRKSLQRQPEHVRNFLLQTAILDRLSGSLCDAVTGQDGGGECWKPWSAATCLSSRSTTSASGIAIITFSPCAAGAPDRGATWAGIQPASAGKRVV